MQPQQPYNQPPQQVEQTPYDFILNTSHAPKHPVLSGGGNSFKSRLIFVSAIGGGLLLLLIVMTTLLSGGSGRDALLRVQQLQTETVRVSKLVINDVASQTIKNVTMNASIAAASDKQALTLVASSKGITFSEDALLLGNNSETDTQIETAKAAGLLDQTALEILQAQLEAYESALTSAFDATSSPEIKDELSREYEATRLLLEQLENTQA